MTKEYKIVVVPDTRGTMTMHRVPPVSGTTTTIYTRLYALELHSHACTAKKSFHQSSLVLTGSCLRIKMMTAVKGV